MKSNRLLAGVCAVLMPLAALATPVTYEFTGVLNMAGGQDLPEGQMFVPIIPLESEFTASITIENETAASVQAPGVLRYFGAIVGATISFGPGGSLGAYGISSQPYSPFTTESNSILFINDNVFNGNPPYDQFTLNTSMENHPGDPPNRYWGLSFITADYSAQQLPSGMTLLDPLPVDALTSLFHQLSFGYATYDDAGNEIEGSYVGSQQVTIRQVPSSVPEPGTLPLWGAGLGGLWLATRRRGWLETKRAAN